MYATAMERLELNDREDQYSGAPLQIRGDEHSSFSIYFNFIIGKKYAITFW